ncbi:STE20-related kinase adapter protein alpha isoform X2 [Nilaparvata lugens]|uniref:STE20-related kinase adapter protein alpha isoform X2 n=1 Tax=Nilaparvata lugens TaxID=108931 RepID=UPI00193D4475|nr:STE20-related kinase adapter protein alpha isoform X2 [Nilaparvata lugens]XP_039298752.1 STE20-related kinase adapter protein alpha isoform X2 [Nilaparvata lugens]
MSIKFTSDPMEYQLCSLLGQCTTDIAVVFLGRYTTNGCLVAMKKYNMEKISRAETELIKDEIILMRQLSHSNLLPCLTSFVSGHDVVAISPLMGYGSCHDLILRHFNTGLPELLIAIILRDILQALNYMHQKGMIHRAVRASHILVGADGVRLTGLRYACCIRQNSYNYSRRVHSFPLSTEPNLSWLSPEILQQNLLGYNEKSDVYSVGITCCELANGVVPFADTPTTLMLTEKVRGMAPQLLDRTTYVLYDDTGQPNDPDCCRMNDQIKEYSLRKFSEPFHDLNELCLMCDPQERPTPAQLLSHAFFKQNRRNTQPLHELLLPAVPIAQENVPVIQGDLEMILAEDKMSALDLCPVNWDFDS